MTEAKVRTIYDNYNLHEMYDEMKEELIVNGNSEPTESQIWDAIHHEDAVNWECEKEMMSEVFNGENKFIAVGTCGTWQGNFAGGLVFSTLDEFISQVFKDCDYFKFYDKNGHFYVDASHHDGSHHLEIKQLTESGISYLENWENNWNDSRNEQYIHKRLFDKYSKLIHYAHTVFGCPKYEYEDVKGVA